MPETKLSAIDQLDKDYEESLKTAEPETAAEPVEEEKVDSEPEKVEKVTEQPKEQPKEQSKDQKADHAFKQMREELNELKKQNSTYSKAISNLEKFAKENGFDSIEDLVAKTEDYKLQNYAKKNNLPKEVVKELNDTKKELELTKQQVSEREQQSKISELTQELDRIGDELQLTNEQSEKIVQDLVADGYNIENLSVLPRKSLQKIIKGYAADLITEREIQKKLSGKKKEFKEEKHNTVTQETTTDDPFSSEALAKDIANYRKQNYPWMK